MSASRTFEDGVAIFSVDFELDGLDVKLWLLGSIVLVLPFTNKVFPIASVPTLRALIWFSMLKRSLELRSEDLELGISGITSSTVEIDLMLFETSSLLDE